MTFKRLKFGLEGEKKAVKFLKQNKYRILETNFTTTVGEIDIVAEQGGVLVFIEVKSRVNNEHGHPLDAVTPIKQRKLKQVAESFRVSKGLLERDCRFDVVAISGEPENPKSWEVEIYQDAFRI